MGAVIKTCGMGVAGDPHPASLGPPTASFPSRRIVVSPLVALYRHLTRSRSTTTQVLDARQPPLALSLLALLPPALQCTERTSTAPSVWQESARIAMEDKLEGDSLTNSSMKLSKMHPNNKPHCVQARVGFL